MKLSGFAIRPVEPEDSHALVALVTACWAPYPGCIMDVDTEEADLKAPERLRSQGGFWVARLGPDVAQGPNRLVGCVGFKQHGDTQAELVKLYVAPDLRRAGLASALLTKAESELPSGTRRLQLWTDTRFTQAHAFYEAKGFHATGAERALHDLSQTREYAYEKEL